MLNKKSKSLLAQLCTKGYKGTIDLNDATSKPISNISKDALKRISGGKMEGYIRFEKSF